MESREHDNSNHPAPLMPEPGDGSAPVEYAGFWIRFLASVLDSILMIMVMVPLLLVFYGPGVLVAQESPGLMYDLINYGLPVVAVIIFWQYRSATPGKMMMGIYIVDAKTLEHPPFGRLVLRYFGYYLSILPLLLGFIWVAFDPRKQGFHDKIAGTVVIKKAADVSQNGESAGVAEGKTKEEDSQISSATTIKHDPWKE